MHLTEPLFWMHHAVSHLVLACALMDRDRAKVVSRLQMVDKVWYDWQHRNPANAMSYFGGSVQALQNLSAYDQYPNGGPPYLGVSTFHFRSRNSC